MDSEHHDTALLPGCTVLVLEALDHMLQKCPALASPIVVSKLDCEIYIQRSFLE